MAEVAPHPQQINLSNPTVNSIGPQVLQQPQGFQITTKHITTAVLCLVVAVVTYYAYEYFVKNQDAESTDASDKSGKKENSQDVSGYNLHESLRRIVDRQNQISQQLSRVMN